MFHYSHTSSMTDCCVVLLHYLLTNGLSTTRMANIKMCIAQSRRSCLTLLSMKTPTQARAARCEVDRRQKNFRLRSFVDYVKDA